MVSELNVVSIGDAEHEFYALTDLYGMHKNRHLKTVRFIKEPSFDILIDQLEVLDKVIDKVVSNQGHLDLVFHE